VGKKEPSYTAGGNASKYNHFFFYTKVIYLLIDVFSLYSTLFSILWTCKVDTERSFVFSFSKVLCLVYKYSLLCVDFVSCNTVEFISSCVCVCVSCIPYISYVQDHVSENGNDSDHSFTISISINFFLAWLHWVDYPVYCSKSIVQFDILVLLWISESIHYFSIKCDVLCKMFVHVLSS
jgi:hypothetical protein